MVFSLCVSVISGTESESASDSDLLAVHTGMDHPCMKVKVRFAVEKRKRLTMKEENQHGVIETESC